MQFSYQNHGNHTYLIYEVGSAEELDRMSLGMITNNKISGLAPAFYSQMNDISYINYNVTAHVPSSQFLSGQVNKRRLLAVFQGIVEALISADEYMIDESSIILDLDYIFSDVSSGQTMMICLPIRGMEVKKAPLGMFFKQIIYDTQFDQSENCDYVAKLLTYLNSKPMFSLEEFKVFLLNLSRNQESNGIGGQQSAVAVNAEPRNGENAIRKKSSGDTEYPSRSNPIQQQNRVQPRVIQENISRNQESSCPPYPQEQEDVEKTREKEQEKTISLFSLLRNYSKENAEIYKMQKQKGREKGKAEKKDAKKSAKKQSTNLSPGFAIPGQQNEMDISMAVREQAATISPRQPVVPRQDTSCMASQEKYGEHVYDTGAGYGDSRGTSDRNKQDSRPETLDGIAFNRRNFGETTVLGQGNAGETSVLNASMLNPKEQPLRPFLYRKRTGEKVEVNKPVYRIGKEKSYVDFFIGDNTAISRSHCNIITKGDRYCIVDTNSTNHTFVNGAMISSNIEMELADGDRIRLADEDFDFRLEH